LQAKNYYNNKGKKYRKLWVSCIRWAFIVQLLDVISWSLVGVQGVAAKILSYSVNCIGFILISVLSSVLALFIEYNINYSDKKYNLLLKIFCPIIIIESVLSILSLKFGFYFELDQYNNYIRGNFIFVGIILSYLPLIIVFFRTLIVYNQESLHLRGILITGILFPTIFNVLQVTNTFPIPILFPSITLSILFFYLFLINNSFYIDYLTGLNNSRGVNKYFDDLSPVLNNFLVVIFIDIDGFKLINDVWGHKEGDNAIITFSKIISKGIRKNDLVARIGGDEFLIAAVVNKEDEADFIVDKINKELLLYNNLDNRYKLSMSYGISITPPNVRIDKEEIIKDADEKMYLQKNKCINMLK
jgi:diguanylate cyclase (GGDEF)-like protein